MHENGDIFYVMSNVSIVLLGGKSPFMPLLADFLMINIKKKIFLTYLTFNQRISGSQHILQVEIHL